MENGVGLRRNLCFIYVFYKKPVYKMEVTTGNPQPYALFLKKKKALKKTLKMENNFLKDL